MTRQQLSATRVMLTSGQTSQRLGGISRRTIGRYLRLPEVEFPVPIVIRGRLYFYSDEVDAWANSRQRASFGASMDAARAVRPQGRPSGEAA